MGTAYKEQYGWNDDMDLSLLQKLKADLKLSMQNRDDAVKGAIRVVMSEFPKITVPITLESGKKTTRPKKPEEISNDDIIAVLRGLIKSEKTTLELKKEATSEYLEVLNAYLPQMATRENIRSWIDENIDFSQYKNAMQAMGPIMKHFGRAADGNLVREVLAEIAQQ